MLILGIETSCDETSAAIVRDGKDVVSNIVFSQEYIHKRYGGIVPELACRRHIEVIDMVVLNCLKDAEISFSDIEAVAVTSGPGLIGALLVGVYFAKGLAYGLQIPLLAINHLDGHIMASFIEDTHIEFPLVALIASGGHTHLYYVEDILNYKQIGRTLDDAAGEALDKGAKMLGLGYPGGPVIEKLAATGISDKIQFPRAYLSRDSLDFSFSGLKTSLLNYLRNKDSVPESELPDITASYQQAIIEVLINKTIAAAIRYKVKGIIVAGGVSANSLLRKYLAENASKHGLLLYMPSLQYCTDNAAMIAVAGYHHYLKGRFASLDMIPEPNMVLSG
ncbi:MAG: tRNA (adenosine(37)-N6)-threonylcarbamoyltransferase complex transferase subunit TsaD [Nitrospirota bacterium]